MKKKYCQSCGMPMGETNELYGMEKDGSKNTDYCHYCFKDGAFTYNATMEEMINICVPHFLNEHPEMKKEDAEKLLKEMYPQLKRWKKN